MFDSLRLLLAQLLALLQTRLELITTELSAEVQRAVRVLVLAFVALLFGALGFLMLAVTLLVAFWEGHRLLASALITITFLGIASVAVWQAWRAVSHGPRLLESTLEELRRDRDALAAVRERVAGGAATAGEQTSRVNGSQSDGAGGARNDTPRA